MRKSRTYFLSGFGDPGHTFPLIALGKALRQRGHSVTVQTWGRWRAEVEAEDLSFAAAPEYQLFPARSQPLKPYQAAVRAAQETREAIEELKPDVVVSDVITVAPALAAELQGTPWVTLVPHVFPCNAAGLPPFGLGAHPPRTPVGKALWRLLAAPAGSGVRMGREQLNDSRARLGLAPDRHLYGSISRQLCLVGTFPQLEYPRAWPAWAQVTGPCMWEPPANEVEIPVGAEPLVLIAPSTSKDPGQRLLLAAVEGLEELPVRVLATTNRRPPACPIPRARNATVVEWLSYARAMPHADLVICHGGHGTLARALASGVPVIVLPVEGDMAENAARLRWSGAGLSLPWRLAGPRTIKWAVRRILADGRYRRRAQQLQRWASDNDGAANAASALEDFGLLRGRGSNPQHHG